MLQWAPRVTIRHLMSQKPANVAHHATQCRKLVRTLFKPASRRHHQHATSCAASSPSFLVAAVRRRSFAKFTSERVFPCAPNRICANNCRIIATHAHYATIDVEKSARFDRMHYVTSLRASRHATRICSARELTSSYTASLASKSNRKVSKPGGENGSFVAL